MATWFFLVLELLFRPKQKDKNTQNGNFALSPTLSEANVYEAAIIHHKSYLMRPHDLRNVGDAVRLLALVGLHLQLKQTRGHLSLSL